MKIIWRKCYVQTNFIDYKKYLRSDYWNEIKEQVLERDDYRCRLCDSKKDLQVHHRTYEFLGNEKIEELLTLCKKCHYIVHKRNPQLSYKIYCDNKKWEADEREIEIIKEHILNNHDTFDILKQRLKKEKYIRTSEFQKIIKKLNKKKFDGILFINCCLNYINGISIYSWNKKITEKYDLPKRSVNIIVDKNIYDLDIDNFYLLHYVKLF